MSILKKEREKHDYISWLLYALLIVAVVAYAFTSSILVGIGAFALVVVILMYEFRQSIKEEGTKGTVVDVAKALAVVAVIWIVLILVLGTTQPVNVVASCSMLPVLNRGDLVFLHGISNMSSFLQSNRIPVINVSQSQFDNMEANMKNEFLAYFAYAKADHSDIGYIGNFSNSTYGIGLYNTMCIDYYSSLSEPTEYARCAVPAGYQSRNLIRYNYSIGKAVINGITEQAVYTSSITIANHTVIENYSNPIIIYQTTPSDYFSGDIIHRVVAALNVNGSYYILTKGDNNPGLDMEFGNYPVNQSSVIGYNVATVPFIGYLKLILSGQIGAVAGCNQTMLR